ncbi:hypothetical protein MMC10_005760 [Thelotrema lepadinum]|nr:hypothetical protein [Thelotrema lepadinum]
MKQSGWELDISDFTRLDSECIEKKNELDSVLKKKEENKKILDWIRHANDDEPSHQKFVEKTGLKVTTDAGKWILGQEEFSSWVGEVGSKQASKRAFWIRGSAGTGKTTLL